MQTRCKGGGECVKKGGQAKPLKPAVETNWDMQQEGVWRKAACMR